MTTDIAGDCLPCSADPAVRIRLAIIAGSRFQRLAVQHLGGVNIARQIRGSIER